MAERRASSDNTGTTLIAAEFAFAALLLAGGGLLLKSFATLLRIQPGFETAGRYTADIVIPADQYKDNAQRITFYRELFRRLNETPGIRWITVFSVSRQVVAGDRVAGRSARRQGR